MLINVVMAVEMNYLQARVDREESRVATTYKPGETVPRDGTVECTQYNGTRDKVKAGTKFAPCDHWGDHHGKQCTWQYV